MEIWNNTGRYINTPRTWSTHDRGWMPPAPYYLYDAADNRSWRQSYYWLNPRLHTGGYRIGLGGPVDQLQDATDGYGIPVLVGAGLGWLWKGKKGALIGGALGAGARFGIRKARDAAQNALQSVQAGAQRALQNGGEISEARASAEGFGFLSSLGQEVQPVVDVSARGAKVEKLIMLSVVIAAISLLLTLAETQRKKDLAKRRNRRRRRR